MIIDDAIAGAQWISGVIAKAETAALVSFEGGVGKALLFRTADGRDRMVRWYGEARRGAAWAAINDGAVESDVRRVIPE